MALIKCSECGAEMSDLANACPKCAFPIKPNNVQTIEQTSKRLKLYYILSVFLILIGAMLSLNGCSSDSSESNNIGFGGLLLIIGIIFFIVTKFRIWWNHK